LKTTVGRISKCGDVYLRTLLTHGARALLRSAALRAAKGNKPLTHWQRWMLAVEARRGHNKATVAVANKLARIVWAVWRRDRDYAGPDISD